MQTICCIYFQWFNRCNGQLRNVRALGINFQRIILLDICATVPHIIKCRHSGVGNSRCSRLINLELTGVDGFITVRFHQINRYRQPGFRHYCKVRCIAQGFAERCIYNDTATTKNIIRRIKLTFRCECQLRNFRANTISRDT